MLSLSRLSLIVLTVLCAGVPAAREETRVGSTRPVASPDGTRQAVVDHLMPVVDGEVDRFSGRMSIRVTDTEGTATRKRPIETSQVSVIQTPRWLGADLVAFFYNIKKNANGVIYYDVTKNEAVQVEFVNTVRRMGASNTIATELTSLEIAIYGEADEPECLSTIVQGGGAVFPLFLKPLPAFDNAPFPVTVLEDIRAAVAAWRAFLAGRKIAELDVEVGSEDFSPDGARVALLACADGKPVLVMAPLKADSAAAAMSAVVVAPLAGDVELNCAVNAPPPDAAPSGETSAPGPGEFGGYRFTAKWTGPNSVQVVREVFETEEEPTRREPFYEVGTDGSVKKLERKPAPPPEAAAPAPRPAKPETGAGTTPAPSRKTPAPRRAAASPTPAAAAPAPPQDTPKPRLNVLRKLLPGEKNPPADTPAAGR